LSSDVKRLPHKKAGNESRLFFYKSSLEIKSSYLKNKTGFLIGAAGSGMSSLGHILLDFGVDLIGSDLKKNSAIINLEKKI
jgi:hypothetical protein